MLFNQFCFRLTDVEGQWHQQRLTDDRLLLLGDRLLDLQEQQYGLLDLRFHELVEDE